MNNLVRKLLSFLLAVTLLLTVAMPVLATEVVATAQTDSFNANAMNEYVERHVIAFLRMNKLLDNGGNVSISQAFPINNDDSPNNYIYFLFVDYHNVGYVCAGYFEGEYSCSFISNGLAEIDSANEYSTPIAIAVVESRLYLVLQDSQTPLSEATASNASISDVSSASYKHSIITLSQINYSNNLTRGSTINVLLDVPIVANESIVNSQFPAGLALCWLSCISSIAAFMNNDSTPDNPVDLFNWIYLMRDQYNIDLFGGYEYPEGIEHFEDVYFNTYYQLNLDCYQNGLDFYEVVSLLNQDIPIYTGIVVNANDEDGHAIVICGAYYDSANDEYYYTLMDPNENSYVSIIDNTPLDKTFTYNPNHWAMPTYEHWLRCYY